MHEQELEAALRVLWARSSTPVTTEQLQKHLGLPKSDVEHAMRALLRVGSVDVDVAQGGEVCWVAHGTKAAVVAPVQPVRTLTKIEESAPTSTVNLSVPGTGFSVQLSQDPNRKSVLLSAGMGLLFGPFGWLYAGPWLETAIGVAIYVALALVLPRFLLGPFFGLIHPACGVLAMLHAWRFNRVKKRTPLLLAPPEAR